MSLKKIVKQSKLLSYLYYKYRMLNNALNMFKYRFYPVQPCSILFNNFNGKGFGDSQRAVAETMHKIAPKWKLYWAINGDAELKTLPEYIIPVRFNSKDYFNTMSTVHVWVYNVLLPEGTKKKNNQLYIQTWHGDKGFKKFGNDAIDIKNYAKGATGRKFTENELCDYFLCGSDWFVPIYKSAVGYSGEVVNKGLPRNDCLFVKNSNRELEIRKKLGLKREKILLYAPTFRDHKSNNGKVDSEIDIQRLLDELSKETNEKWICLARAHTGHAVEINGNKLIDSNIINVSLYPDMADLLLISDLLITDYSSCAGDFALTNKPVLLYQDDYDSYTTKDRTLYFDMEDTPFKVAKSMKDAIQIIHSGLFSEAADNDEQIREFYKVTETGSATENICHIILDYEKQSNRN